MKRRQLLQRAATGLALVAGPQVIDMGSSSGSSQDATSPLNEQLSVVSLSHVNDPATTPVFPGDPEFTLDTAATIANDGYYLQYVKEGEHTGTHWGAPAHFQEGGLTADQLDPADLFLPAVKIDIRDKAAADSDYALTVADLQEWETRWGSEEYANSDAEGVTHQPGFSVDAARWLIDTGRLGTRGALGTDTFGPDLGNDETYPVSTILYDKHRISLENLNNLAALPTTGASILVGGAINKAGSGSPATIFALLRR